MHTFLNHTKHRIDSLIDELSDLLDTKFKANGNAGNGDETSLKTSNNKMIDSIDINTLQSSLETIAEMLEREDCDHYFESLFPIDINTLQSSLETIAEMLEREDCDHYFESLFPLILKLKTDINFVYWINSGDNKPLTTSNVSLNSIWETICYKMEKMIMNSVVRCDYYANELDVEKSNKSADKQTPDGGGGGGEGLDMWRLFDTIRVCKLESESIELSDKPIDEFVKRLVSMIVFDLRLFKNGYFGTFTLLCDQLVMPYTQALKTRFNAELLALNTSAEDLISIIKCMLQWDRSLREIRQEFPRLMTAESPESSDNEFDWKSTLESTINQSSNLSENTDDNNVVNSHWIQYIRPHLMENTFWLSAKHNSWTEFDRSTILGTEPRIWWYSALELIITPTIDKYLTHNLKTIINKSVITSMVTPEIKEIFTTNAMIYEDLNHLIEEGLEIMFTTISDLIQTLPTTLIVSLEMVNQSVPAYVKPLSASITLNFLISLLLKRLKTYGFANNDKHLESIRKYCHKLDLRFRDTFESEKHFTHFIPDIKARKPE
ncbi:unnamed protein product, partial [Medioppia subpectinata]